MNTNDLRRFFRDVAALTAPLLGTLLLANVFAAEFEPPNVSTNQAADSPDERVPRSDPLWEQRGLDRAESDPRATPTKIIRYAKALLSKYDADADGRLNKDEWTKMRGDPQQIDRNGDAIIAMEELLQHVVQHGARRKIRLMTPLARSDEPLPPLLNPTTAARPADAATTADGQAKPEGSPAAEVPASGSDPRRSMKFYMPAARLPQGLPPWFLDRDADGDGQLTMAEFAPQATASQIAEFARYDLDADGLLTAQEYLRAVKAGNRAAQ
ncbi:MAG: hypothetical protein KJZ87_24960 [Thermoguttaceae bacterium]|nr:hypothetical protein [Thermoguttaceae bacterium]